MIVIKSSNGIWPLALKASGQPPLFWLSTLKSEIVVPGTFIKFSDFSHQYYLISAGTFINLAAIRSCIENQSFSKCESM